MVGLELSGLARFERACAATAAGATSVNGIVIDTAGAERVCFVTVLGDGTNTGTVLVKAQSGSASDGSDMADITGATTATATSDGTNTDNKLLVLDVVKPLKRYVRIVVVRAVANHVIDSAVAIVYDNRDVPVTQTNSLSTVQATG